MPGTMNAVVMHAPGGPEVLKVETQSIPQPDASEVLIKVHALGLNRSELFTRQGHSPRVRWPRILGIEAVGTVAESPGVSSNSDRLSRPSWVGWGGLLTEAMRNTR